METQNHYVRPNGTLEDRSLGELMRDLSSDSMHLIQQEAQLFRIETEQKLVRVQREAMVLGAGAGVAVFGAFALLAAVILLLSEVIAPWLAAFLVGAALTIGGVVMVMQGKKKLQQESLAPKRTMNSVKQDVRTFREAWR